MTLCLKDLLKIIGITALLSPLFAAHSQSGKQLDTAFLSSEVSRHEILFEKGEINGDSLAQVCTNVAEKYLEAHDFRNSRLLLIKSLTYLDTAKNESLMAYNHLKLAEMAMEEDESAKALELLMSVLELYKDMGDSVNYLLTLRKVGINYDYLNDHETARQYYDECIALAEKLDRPDVIGACYNTIAAIYSVEGEHQKAISIFEKAIAIGEEIEDLELLHKLYHNTALAYKRMELFAEAKVYLQKSMAIAQMTNDPKILGFANQGFGFYYLSLGKLDSSEFYMNRTLTIAKKIRNSQLKANAWEALEEIYFKTGRYEEAYNLLKVAKASEDSLYTLENSRIVESIRAKYNEEKRERELVEKNLQLKEASYNLARKNNLQTALIVVVALLLIIIFLIYRGYTLRQKANELLKLQNQQIEDHVAHVENLNKTKSRWFINVAHELRTPLTLIKGPVNRVLSQFEIPEEAREDLKLVERNAENLSNLVNEILDLSKLEAGKITLKESVFSIYKLTNQIVQSFESRAEQLRVNLHCKCQNDVFIKADKDKIQKILINLISNALKFTPKGGRIEVLLKQDKAYLEVIVKDTGTGIGAEDLPFVFDRFFQSSDPNDQASGGTGIGLALSKEIAEMHGGELRASSQKGVGSAFSLLLPSKRITKPEENQGSEKSSTVEAMIIDKKPAMLLVDDNVDMRSYVASLLSQYFEIIEASDGEQALQKLAAHHIRFIVCDVMMSGMDGISLLKKVKSEPLWSHLPFIHLSALDDDKLKKEVLRIGIDDFLVKPFDPEELIIRVKNLYDNYLNRSALDITVEDDSYDEQTIRKLKDAVLNNMDDSHFNVIRLAHEAGMSERQLYRYLKSATGLTPLQFIQEIKLTKANEFLHTKTYSSTGELAAAVGFKQSSYFSTLFEKRFGKKPAAYMRD